jgi:hypothetical protein
MHKMKIQSVSGGNLNDADDVVPVAASDDSVDDSIHSR